MPILAYHIIWTTYGTWLPGDERGWISSNRSGIQAPDPEREHAASALMAEDAAILSPSQRVIVETIIAGHCRIRNWTLHALQARTNHVHVVVTADCNPDEVMKQFKAWCSRRLSDAAGLAEAVAKRAGRRHWFTEGGDKEIIEDETYLENAIRYVNEGQDKPRSRSARSP
ncbi:MAG: transposase [Pirellulales bacterium]|nr:transposase [Pirellulales bacterium]